MVKKGSRFLLACLFAAGILAGAILSTAPVRAEETNLKEITFSAGDPAFKTGAEIYHNYLISIGAKPSEIEPADPKTEFARYLPLDNTDPHRFLGYYIINGIGECALAGCEFLVFEYIGNRSWRLVIDSLAQQIWINRDDRSKPKEIYLKSLRLSTQSDKPEPIGVWSWNGDKYTFNRSFFP